MSPNAKKEHAGRHHRGRRGGRRSHAPKKKRIYPEYEGKVLMSRDGYIFVRIEGQEEDVFVKAVKTQGALHGDTVRVAITQEKTDGVRRRMGEVVEIVRRSDRPFVGVLHLADEGGRVAMTSRTMPYDITVPIPEGGVQGMKVAVQVDGWEKGQALPHGHVVDVLGLPGENDTEMHAILAEYGLPYRFPPEVEAAAAALPDAPTEKDMAGRRDFRPVLTFTIDPGDAKDFDDAISFQPLEDGGCEVGVHIADVTHYVKPGDTLDKEAQERGVSVYLVDRTVPMLPEKLSNLLCSLRPHEEKLCFSAVFTFDKAGEVRSSWFGRTVILSDYRFSYEGAQEVIEAGEAALDMELGQGSECGAVPREVKAAVLRLHQLSTVLRRKRFAGGAINFDRPEMKVQVDAQGKPIGVRQKISTDANWLIEEFMLLANRHVAEFIAGTGKTFVYRIHGEPKPEKLASLRAFADSFGYKTGSFDNGKDAARSLNALMRDATGKPELGAIQILALRSMAKAAYSTKNIGHYGLSFPFYTHFTSPIRRYPDMMVHRLLALYLDGAPSQDAAHYEQLCKYTSQREGIAVDAERDSIKYKLVEFMQDKVGMEFDGHISGVSEWGIYVEVEPTKIEGMIPFRTIRSEFFDYDEQNYRAVGRRTGRVLRLGDAMHVRVKCAQLEQKFLDYEWMEDVDSAIPREKASPTGERTVKRAEKPAKSAKPTREKKSQSNGHGARGGKRKK